MNTIEIISMTDKEWELELGLVRCMACGHGFQYEIVKTSPHKCPACAGNDYVEPANN